MAKKTVTTRVCDVHDGDALAVNTVRLGWDGQNYQLDLCADHEREIASTLQSWTAGASGPRRARRSAKATKAKRTAAPANRTAAPAKSAGARREKRGGGGA